MSDLEPTSTADAPREERESSLGPNPFEDAYLANDSQSKPQSPTEEAATDTTEATAETASAEEGVGSEAGEAPGSNDPEKQALYERLAQLEQRVAEGGDPPQAGTQPGNNEVNWDNFSPTPLPEELRDYQEAFTGLVRESAMFLVGELETQAQARDQAETQQHLRSSLQSQVKEMEGDSVYSDYPQYYARMQEIVRDNGSLLQRPNGLKAVYHLAKGEVDGFNHSPVQGENGGDYARGVKAGLDQVQAKRQAAVPPTPTGSAPTESARPKYKNLDEAINTEFARAVREAQQR